MRIGGFVMKAKLLALIAATLFFLAAADAHAAVVDVNLNQPGGIPGTGGTADWFGPCYCEDTITYTPIYSVSPGETINFGSLLIYPFAADATPDAGPYQMLLGLESNVGVSFSPPLVPPQMAYFENPPLTGSPTPSVSFGFGSSPCQLYSQSCSLTAAGFNPILETLSYVAPDGATDIQLAWVGPYDYDPPATPVPTTLPLFATGLGVMGLFGWRRKRKNVFQ